MPEHVLKNGDGESDRRGNCADPGRARCHILDVGDCGIQYGHRDDRKYAGADLQKPRQQRSFPWRPRGLHGERSGYALDGHPVFHFDRHFLRIHFYRLAGQCYRAGLLPVFRHARADHFLHTGRTDGHTDFWRHKRDNTAGEQTHALHRPRLFAAGCLGHWSSCGKTAAGSGAGVQKRLWFAGSGFRCAGVWYDAGHHAGHAARCVRQRSGCRILA